MKFKNIFLFVILVISSMTVATNFEFFLEKKYVNSDYYLINETGGVKSPVSLKMYELIEKYSEEYDIPKHIAYNVAYLETRYEGPFDWNYNPYLTSNAGAEGPMQIMPSTAKFINKEKVDNHVLRTNLNLNIETSMKLLRRLYDKYGSWSLVCGCYNTGQPIVNSYAVFCSTNTNYRSNSVSPNK